MEELWKDRQTALLVVDQQRDFEPGGALAVSGGDEIAEPIAELMTKFQFVAVTQDSHPPGHISFASSYKGKKPFDVLTIDEVEYGGIQSHFSRETLIRYLKRAPHEVQVLWPDHCVQGTAGWEFNPKLPLHRANVILRKGTRMDCDSYSAFFENDGSPTGLVDVLRSHGIRRILTVGLAGDYCVYWTAKDAFRERLKVVFDEQLTRFVNFPEKSREMAIQDLKSKGAEFMNVSWTEPSALRISSAGI